MDIDKARERLFKADRDLQEFRNRQALRTAELQQEMNKVLAASFGQEGQALRAAYQTASNDLVEAQDNLKVEQSLQNLPFPEGTVLVKWKPTGWTGREYRKTDEKGKFQVVRPGDKLHRHFSVGGWCVRNIKKDGTPGNILSDYLPDSWLPEDVVVHPTKKTYA